MPEHGTNSIAICTGIKEQDMVWLGILEGCQNGKQFGWTGAVLGLG